MTSPDGIYKKQCPQCDHYGHILITMFFRDGEWCEHCGYYFRPPVTNTDDADQLEENEEHKS